MKIHAECTDPQALSVRKNPRAHKNKIGTSPPPPPKPPPKTGNFTDAVFPAERTHFFRVSIKLAHPFPAPELRTRILRIRRLFLILSCLRHTKDLFLFSRVWELRCEGYSNLDAIRLGVMSLALRCFSSLLRHLRESRIDP